MFALCRPSTRPVAGGRGARLERAPVHLFCDRADQDELPLLRQRLDGDLVDPLDRPVPVHDLIVLGCNDDQPQCALAVFGERLAFLLVSDDHLERILGLDLVACAGVVGDKVALGDLVIRDGHGIAIFGDHARAGVKIESADEFAQFVECHTFEAFRHGDLARAALDVGPAFGGGQRLEVVQRQ